MDDTDIRFPPTPGIGKALRRLTAALDHEEAVARRQAHDQAVESAERAFGSLAASMIRRRRVDVTALSGGDRPLTVAFARLEEARSARRSATGRGPTRT